MPPWRGAELVGLVHVLADLEQPAHGLGMMALDAMEQRWCAAAAARIHIRAQFAEQLRLGEIACE